MYCRAWPTDFKFSHLKDSVKLAAFDEKHNVADKRVFKNAIYDVKKAKYITFIDPICELSPNSMGVGQSFNSGGILANVSVYDIETGELVNSLSVFAFNSGQIEYQSVGSSGYDFGPNTSLLNKDLIGNFHKVLKLKLNEVAKGTSSPAGSAGATLQQ